jgi:hypothetical protein
MFEHQTVTIKSGTGNNYFEAAVTLDTMARPEQTKAVMDNLRQMQKDRMEWAASPAAKV